MGYRLVSPPPQDQPPKQLVYRLVEAPAPKTNDPFAGAGSFLTGIVEGVPVAGPYALGGLQRIGAYGRSLRTGNSYEQELAAVRGMTSRAQAEHPYLATAGNVAGAVAGLAPVAVTGPGAAALGITGRNLLGRAAAGAASGASIGAADSAVRSDADPIETAKGAAFGFAGGALAPYAGQAIGAGVRKVAEAMRTPGGALSGIPRRAAVFASETLPNARAAAVQAELARLGPDATLADVSPEWMGVARGASSRPGSRDEIVNFFNSRGGGANARLASDLDSSLGRAIPPSQIEETLAASRKALSPEYERAFKGARAVDTNAIARDLDAAAINLRGPAQKAAQRVRSYLDVPGTGELDRNPRTLFEVRQAIDGLLDGEQNSKVIAVLAKTRREVDELLSHAVPGVKAVDAKFAALARESEALQRGGQILDSGKTALRPEGLAGELAAGGNIPDRFRQGARAEIDRVAGTNSNDPAALQRLVKGEGDWNRAKLRQLYGANADAALNAIDRETTFYRTANRVTSGSDTAMARGFGDFLNEAATPRDVPVGASATGMVMRALQEATRGIRGNNAAAKAEKFAKDLGLLSIATGPRRDALVDALVDYARKREGGKATSQAVARVTQLLAHGGQEPIRIRSAHALPGP